jgi:trehalose 6-phosphate phosphatase
VTDAARVEGPTTVLDPSIVAALAPLVAEPRATAVLTDFDGTLAPIVADPATVRPLPGAAETLARLVRSFGLVAVVSGRPVAFLVDRLGPAAGAVSLVGLYGLERRVGGAVAVLPDAEPWRRVVAGVVGRLERTVPAGVWVEPKGLTVTVHWRAAPDRAPEAESLVAAEVATTGLLPHPGRMSVELRPPIDVDKGSAVTGLAEGFRSACFLGDDLGDLPAFAALDRLSSEGVATVAVAAVDGESSPEVAAAADLVVDGPGGALAVLRWLADAADA